MKSDNYNLPATQFISKESDYRIERDLRTSVKYRIEKLAELGLV